MTPASTGVSAPTLRPRVRLLLLVGLVVAWWLRWTTVQTASGVAIQDGPDRTGAIGAFALLFAWGYAATLLVSRSPRGVRSGAAVTDAVVATIAAIGLGCAHPALGASVLAGTAFAALALLALLQLFVAVRHESLAREVALVRAVAGLGVGILLGTAGARTIAGLALWLASSALFAGLPRSADGPRRGVELLLGLLALVVLFAPQLHDLSVGITVERTGVYEGYFLWLLGGVGLALLSAAGLLRAGETR